MNIKLLSVSAFLFVSVPFSACAVMEASWDDEGVELAEKPEHCPMNIYIKNADVFITNLSFTKNASYRFRYQFGS